MYGLYMQTYKSVLQIYGLHFSKEAAILQSAPVQGQDHFRRVDLYLQSSIVLSNAGMAIANDLVCDSRCILLGFSDGSFQCYSWHCKVKHHHVSHTTHVCMIWDGVYVRLTLCIQWKRK